MGRCRIAASRSAGRQCCDWACDGDAECILLYSNITQSDIACICQIELIPKSVSLGKCSRRVIIVHHTHAFDNGQGRILPNGSDQRIVIHITDPAVISGC